MRNAPATTNSSVTHGFLGKTVSLATGHILGYVVLLASAPLIARIYGPTPFGVYAVFVTCISCLSMLATLRLDQAILLATTRHEAASTALATLLATLTTVAVLIAGATPINSWIQLATGCDVPELFAWLLAVTVGCSALYQVVAAWLLRSGTYRGLAAMRVSFVLSSVSVQVIVPACGGSVMLGLATGHAVGFACGALVGCWKSRQSWPILHAGSMGRAFQQFVRHRRYPLFDVPATVVSSLNIHGPVLLISILYGAEVAGEFALAQRMFTTPLTLLIHSFSKVFFSQAVAAENRASLEKIFRYSVSKALQLAIGPVALVAAIAPFAFGFCMGSNWASAGIVCTVLAPMMLSLTLANVVAPTFDVLGRQDLKLLRETTCGGLIALGLMGAWFIGASSTLAIASASAGGTIGYLLSLGIGWHCVHSGPSAYNRQHDDHLQRAA